MKDSTKSKIATIIVLVAYAVSVLFVFGACVVNIPEEVCGKWSVSPYVLGSLALTAAYCAAIMWILKWFDKDAFIKMD